MPDDAQARSSGWQPQLAELREREALAHQLGGQERVARQHAGGRLTVRERIERMLDRGSFHEVGAIAGKADYGPDGRITAFTPANCVFGRGTVDGRPVVIVGDDFTLRGGSADASIKAKPRVAEEMATAFRLPLIRLIEGSGGGGSVKTIETTGRANLPGGLSEGSSFELAVANMALVPVVALGLGSVAGLGAARLAASHYSVMVKDLAAVFVAGPPVVKRLGEPRSKQELGGWEIQTACGAVDHAAETEEDAFALTRRFLSYMPNSIWDLPPRVRNWDDPARSDDSLISAVPRDPMQAYHMRRIIERVVDRASFFEMSERFGRPIITGFARLDGWPVALMAGDPLYHGGAWNGGCLQQDRPLRRSGGNLPPSARAPRGLPGFPGGTGSGKLGRDPLGRARAFCHFSEHGAMVLRDHPQRLRRRRPRPPARRPAQPALRLALGKLGIAAATGRRGSSLSRRTRRRFRPGRQTCRDRSAVERATLALPHRRGLLDRRNHRPAGHQAPALRVRHPGGTAAHARPPRFRHAALMISRGRGSPVPAAPDSHPCHRPRCRCRAMSDPSGWTGRPVRTATRHSCLGCP
jgi:hypothetical protein